MAKASKPAFDVIISLNELFPEGLDKAAEWVEGLLAPDELCTALM